MTLKEAYEYGKQELNTAKIDEADLDAWYLLEHVTGVNRAGYFMDMHRELTKEQEEAFEAHIQTRVKRIPLQHITGVQEFMGLKFRVSEHVLIPRQDTEVLVESVLEILRPGMKVLDMCTGSGCILISLANTCASIKGTGVDISEEALKVAKYNALNLHVDASFVHSDLFTEVEGKFDVVVSNPPYIRTEVIEELQEEVKLHDPRLALDGKEDGLFFYRRIITGSRNHLKTGGYLCFEIGHDQGDDVRTLMEEAGFQGVVVKKDLAGLDRVVIGVYI